MMLCYVEITSIFRSFAHMDDEHFNWLWLQTGLQNSPSDASLSTWFSSIDILSWLSSTSISAELSSISTSAGLASISISAGFFWINISARFCLVDSPFMREIAQRTVINLDSSLIWNYVCHRQNRSWLEMESDRRQSRNHSFPYLITLLHEENISMEIPRALYQEPFSATDLRGFCSYKTW